MLISKLKDSNRQLTEFQQDEDTSDPEIPSYIEENKEVMTKYRNKIKQIAQETR